MISVAFLDRWVKWLRIARSRGVWNSVQVRRNSNQEWSEIVVPFLDKPIVARPETADFGTFETVFYHGIYAIHAHLSAKPSIILDGGANIGLATLFFSGLYPGAKIIAVEPEYGNHAMLVENVRHLPNVTAIRAGIWGRECSLLIDMKDLASDAYRTTEARFEDVGDVGGTTISKILSTFSIETLDLLKLDIEGAENSVLMNSDAWIHRVDTMILEIHDCYVTGGRQAILDLVAKRANKHLMVGDVDYFKFLD